MTKGGSRPSRLTYPHEPHNVEAYRGLYDTLSRAYWDASDLVSKDTIHGAQEAAYTSSPTSSEARSLRPTPPDSSYSFRPSRTPTPRSRKSKNSIDQITKNISTAATVIVAINKVLSLTNAL